MNPTLIGSRDITSLSGYFFVFSLIGVVVMGGLRYFSRTHLCKFLMARGENTDTVKILGHTIALPKFVLIALTTLLAVVGGNLYSFYYLFIDPNSFWFGMVLLLLMIVLLTKKSNEFLTR